jgi:hypothetical protein
MSPVEIHGRYNRRTPLGDLVRSVGGVELVRLSNALDEIGSTTSFRRTVPFQSGPPAMLGRAASEAERRAWFADRAGEFGGHEVVHLTVGFGPWQFRQWATIRVASAGAGEGSSWLVELLARGVKHAHVLSADYDSALTLQAMSSETRVWLLRDIRRMLPQWGVDRLRVEREQEAREQAVVRKALAKIPGVQLSEGERPAIAAVKLWSALDAFEWLSWEVTPFARLNACPGNWVDSSRRHAAIAEWLAVALEQFGIERAYYVSLGCRGAAWEHIEVSQPRVWLGALWDARLDGVREGPSVLNLLVLSQDAARVLALRTTTEEELLALSLPTATLLDRFEARHRLEVALSQIDGIRVVGHSQRTEHVGLDEVCRPEFLVGSLATSVSEAERHDWFRATLERLDTIAGSAKPPPQGSCPDAPIGAYELSMGELAPVPWTAVFTYDDGAWVSAILDAGGPQHLLIRPAEGPHALGFRDDRGNHEAFIRSLPTTERQR